jgi:serine/threonine protein kinase
MAQPGTTKIPVGTVLAGKYRITREIGRGGMASVYEAENVDIGKRIAIKVLAQELTSSTIVVERFLREARAAAAIRSPYICDVYDSGRLEDNRPFLVLELLEGESLFERLTQIPYLNVETTLTLITQVCRGLTKAHAANIVHRDLKPENIFLTRDEDGSLLAKILDFGLAKFYAPLTGPEGKAQARLTREGAVFGTPAYMSPEQVRGQGAVDHRADLWALGCITYECLTGKTVWKTEQGVAMTFAQIASAALPDPGDVRPDLPPSFKMWFERALARDLERRFQTAKEFGEALVVALGNRSSLVEMDRVFRSLPPPAAGGPGRAPPQPPAPRADATAAPRSSQEPAPVSGGGRRSFVSEPTVLTSASQPSPPPSGPAPNAANALPPFTGQIPPMAPPRPPPMPQAPGAAYGNASAGPPIPGAFTGAMRPPMPAGAGAPMSPNAFMADSGAGMQLGPGSNEGKNLAMASEARAGRSRAGLIVAAVAVLALGAGLYIGWREMGRPKVSPVAPPPGSASAKVTAESPQPAATATQDPAVRQPLSWVPIMRDAQQALASGDIKGSFKLLKDAFDKGGHGVPRTMLEQVQIGLNAAAAKAPCQLTGLARPRAYDLVVTSGKTPIVGAGRPSITVGPRGPVITWTDAHAGKEHAYAALLDEAMRAVGDPTDITPEGEHVARPDIMTAGDKLVLTYWELRTDDPGVRARWLTPEGGAQGDSVLVGPSKARGASAALGRAADGSFVAVWSNETELSSEDLFLRRVSAGLEPQGDPVRATDYIPTGASKPRARYPSVAIHGDAIHVAFRLEREPIRVVNHMKIPLADAGKGVATSPAPERVDRTMGETLIMNTDKSRAEAPSIACGATACFVVWHVDLQGGISGAYIEHGKAQPVWNKKFSKGARPSVSVSPTGDFRLVWYEGGRVMTAQLGKDGIGPSTKLARVISDQPPPSIAAGSKAGEWYVAWLDYETGHLEPYAARMLCR